MRYCHQSQGNRQSPGRSENQKRKYFSPELPGMGCSGLGVRWTWAQGTYVPSLLSVNGLTIKCFHNSGLNAWCPAGIALWRDLEHGEVEPRSSEYIVLCFSCSFLSLLPVGRHGQSLCHTPLSITKNQAEPLVPSPLWWTDVTNPEKLSSCKFFLWGICYGDVKGNNTSPLTVVLKSEKSFSYNFSQLCCWPSLASNYLGFTYKGDSERWLRSLTFPTAVAKKPGRSYF